jgi:hypothetical protein
MTCPIALLPPRVARQANKIQIKVAGELSTCGNRESRRYGFVDSNFTPEEM